MHDVAAPFQNLHRLLCFIRLFSFIIWITEHFQVRVYIKCHMEMPEI
jgi:hypothetical protein